MRRAYGCNCAGDAEPGACVDPEIVEPYGQLLEDYTGSKLSGCPWRALADPLVVRLFDAWTFYETGQLAIALPQPSYREVQGLIHLRRVLDRIDAKEREREERERKQRPEG